MLLGCRIGNAKKVSSFTQKRQKRNISKRATPQHQYSTSNPGYI